MTQRPTPPLSPKRIMPVSDLLLAIRRLLHLPAPPLPPAPELGIHDGRLLPCTDGRTCVASRGAARSRTYPPIAAPADRHEAFTHLRAVIRTMPRATIVADDPPYLRAVFTLPVFRFEDDVEFLYSDADAAFHFRSASRVGRWDLGVNRRRIRKIRRSMRRLR